MRSHLVPAQRWSLAVAWVLAGCAPASAPLARSTVDAPTPAAPSDEAPAQRAAIDPSCEPAALPPPLASYDAIVEGHRFTLELAQDERGAWAPARPIEMPLHHASRIDWSDAELLEPHQGPALVVATGIGRTQIEHDPARHTWFATYAARIDRVCPPVSP